MDDFFLFDLVVFVYGWYVGLKCVIMCIWYLIWWRLLMSDLIFVVLMDNGVLVSLCFSCGLGWCGFGVLLLEICVGMYWILVVEYYWIGVYIGVLVWVDCVCDGECVLCI